MNSQRGAALVAVMSILTVALMLGITGMQSSAINERLAGNYSATANVQMAAEVAAAQGWSERTSHGRDSVDMDVLSRMSWESFTNDNYLHAGEEFFSEDAVEAGCPDGVECYFRIFDSCEGDNHCIVAMAAIIDGSGRVLAESEQVTVKYAGGSGGSGNGGEAWVVEKVVDGLGDTLINVLRDFGFDSSNNPGARAWESYVGVNETIFSDGEGGLDWGEVADFFRELKSIEDQGGAVTFLSSTSASSGNVSASSGGILVVEGSDDFTIPNNSVFSGVMVITNPGIRVSGGGGTQLEGGILHIPTSPPSSLIPPTPIKSCEEAEADEARRCRPSLDVRGGNGVYSPEAIELAFKAAEKFRKPQILSWR